MPENLTGGRPTTEAVWSWRLEPEEEARRKLEAARQGRRQGALQAVVGFVVAIVIYLFWKPVLAGVVAAVTLVVLALALSSPCGAYRHLTALVARLSHGVGQGMTWLLMPVLYLLVFLPLGTLLRRRLRLTRGPDPALPTYWIVREDSERSAEDYRRQF